MGQKTNPNILRLGITKNNNYRYIEKKSYESALYDFKNLEIKTFIEKFFKDNKLNFNNCKISYSQDGILQIYISYYNALELKTFTVDKTFDIENQYKRYNTYRLFNHIKNLKTKSKKSILLKKKLKVNYYNYIKYNKLTEKKYYNINQIKQDYFINLLCESISKFLKKKISIFLTLKQLNIKLKKNTSMKEKKVLKKKLIRLNRYERNEFFNEGINTLFISAQKSNSASLLAEFIVTQLKNLKRHNFFFKFVKNCLTVFKNTKNSKLKGIKIKIKGRLNRRPRARHKFLKVGKEIPTTSIDSKIDYCEKTSFTPNGTIGIKVWTI